MYVSMYVCVCMYICAVFACVGVCMHMNVKDRDGCQMSSWIGLCFIYWPRVSPTLELFCIVWLASLSQGFSVSVSQAQFIARLPCLSFMWVLGPEFWFSWWCGKSFICGVFSRALASYLSIGILSNFWSLTPLIWSSKRETPTSHDLSPKASVCKSHDFR